jgi:Sporulation and spore germination
VVPRFPTALLLGAVVLFVGACGQEGTATIYLDRGTVLVPVERHVGRLNAKAVFESLIAGPTAAERREGLQPVIHARVRVLEVRVIDGMAVLAYAGPPIRSFAGQAVIVFSLTRLSGISSVSLRPNGEICCVYDQQGQSIDPLTPKLYRGWSAEPCEARSYTDAVPCRG